MNNFVTSISSSNEGEIEFDQSKLGPCEPKERKKMNYVEILCIL